MSKFAYFPPIQRCVFYHFGITSVYLCLLCSNGHASLDAMEMVLQSIVTTVI